MEDKILNNSFNSVEYGTDSLSNTQISIAPAVSGMYEESTTNDIESVYTRKMMETELLNFYMESDFYGKYESETKKIDRSDMSQMYYYFKEKFKSLGMYNMVQIFCCIAEFFDFNYKILYNDVISLEDKAEILEILEETTGLGGIFEKSSSLF